MTEAEKAHGLLVAMGEALYASMAQGALWIALVQAGVLDVDRATMLLDSALLMMEKAQAATDDDAPAWTYARRRLGTLMNQLKALQLPMPPP